MQSLLKIDPLPKKDGGDGTGKDIDPESTPTPGAGTVPPPTAHRAAATASTTPPADGGTGGDGADDARDAADQTPSRRDPAADRGATAGDGGAAAGDRPGNREVAKPRRLPGTARASRPASGPGGQGRETSREPTAQKRHGSSAALVIPIRAPVTYGSGSPAWIRIGPSTSDVLFSRELDPERLGELARAVGQLARVPRRARISSSPAQRLQRADQHGRAHALRLADRVQQRVDAVGAVDVGGARRRRAGRACAA